MAERASPLAEIGMGTSSGAPATLRQVKFAAVLQVAAWPDTLQTVQSVVREIIGVEAPEVGRAIIGENSRLATVAPGRILVAGQAPDLVARFEAALPTTDAAVTDLSHGRVVLRLDGEAEALLTRVVALDVAPSAFPPGRVAQTSIHHLDIVLHRIALDSFEIWTFRSFAESLADWLLDAGLEIGTTFER